MQESRWTVYIIETECGLYYTGISTDTQRRFGEHKNDKKKGAKFFRGRKPKQIVYRQGCENRSEASKQEAAIKKLSKIKKHQLILTQ
ncbi:MAG: GIY-YIG nuclease family protein [Pseudomonadales bacterium]|nr:GIY-YIG nuclease family protein [Pseudomonadales bacterium]